MQSACATAAARQRHIQHFGFQVGLQLGIGQGLATSREKRLDRLLGHIDRRTA
ncbi:hypothetical protein D3C72_2132830 [compost metagenome]